MTKRTFQILMLAAAVSLAYPGKAQATTLTFATGALSEDTAVFGTGNGGVGLFDFRLVFDYVQSAFTIDVTADTSPDLSNLPPGYVCVPINGGTNCVMFTATPDFGTFTPTTNNPTPWLGGYTLTITWQFPTDPLYPNTPITSGSGRIRILHFDSTGREDITDEGSYCVNCKVDGDPAIGGKDDNFSDFIVVQAPTADPNAVVPEPATMVLLGSGLAVLAVRLRRRRRVN